MINMKNQIHRKNDPMSILNHLKKLKSKGKTRTPRPTLEIKSSRVQSTSTVLLKKDVQSIVSLSKQKQRQNSKTLKTKQGYSNQHINNENKYSQINSYRNSDLEIRFRPLLKIINADNNWSNNQNLVYKIKAKFEDFQQHFDCRKSKKVYDELDSWLENICNSFKTLMFTSIRNIFTQHTEKIDEYTSKIGKVSQQYLQELHTLQQKSHKTQNILKQKLLTLSNKNVFTMQILEVLAKNELDFEKWVKIQCFGMQDIETERTIKSESMDTFKDEGFLDKDMVEEQCHIHDINLQKLQQISLTKKLININNRIKEQFEHENSSSEEQEILNESSSMTIDPFYEKLPVESFRKQYKIQQNFNIPLKSSERKQNYSSSNNLHQDMLFKINQKLLNRHKYHHSDHHMNMIHAVNEDVDDDEECWDRFQ